MKKNKVARQQGALARLESDKDSYEKAQNDKWVGFIKYPENYLSRVNREIATLKKRLGLAQ